MSEAQAFPLQWPAGRPRTPRHDRKAASFKTGDRRLNVADGVRRLIAEVSAFTRSGQPWVINPETVVVSTNIRTRGVVPYANTGDPEDVGVAVYFKLRGKPHCVSCDRWNRVADNLAAIAKHLEALRGMERWGVADVESAFAGFKALPPPGGSGLSSALITPPTMSLEQAATTVVVSAGFTGGGTADTNVIASRDTFQTVYRTAAQRLHPDPNGGKVDDRWHTLQQAAELLKKHHGL